MATNANDPIVQTVYRQTGKDSYRPATEKEIKEGIYLVHREGLSKREYFAAMNMEGFAASGFMIDEQCIREAARRSVIAADALIQSLNADNQVKH